MQKPQNNYAFIDSQNLYLAIKELGWKLDYKRFRVYLKEKYGVRKAYMFIGYLPQNQELYNFLQEVGFILVFKPILEIENRPVKGNCDAELVLHTITTYKQYEKALIITGDGDFYCLVKYLYDHNKLLKVLAPSRENCSNLLRKVAKKKLSIVSDLKKKLQYQDKNKKPFKKKS